MAWVVRRMVDWRCEYLRSPLRPGWSDDIRAAWRSMAKKIADDVMARVVQEVGAFQAIEVVETTNLHRPQAAIGQVNTKPGHGFLGRTIACTRIPTGVVWAMVDRRGMAPTEVLHQFESIEAADLDAALAFERHRRAEALARRIVRRQKPPIQHLATKAENQESAR